MAKRICIYGVLSALCIVFGFIEQLISFDFIAPGIKIGLANSVALLLIATGDKKGAFAVNIVRILLSALLFSAPSVLIYSLSGGIVSFIVMCIFSRLKSVGFTGLSIIGAVTHNITQLVCAFLILGGGVIYYLPFLLVSALIGGFVTGAAADMVYKRLKYKF